MHEGARVAARAGVDRARARIHHLGRPSGPPLVLNALPKAGTHLAIRLLEELPGIIRVRLQLSHLTGDRYAAVAGEDVVDLGIAWPVPVSRGRVEHEIRRLPRGAFLTAHLPFDAGIADHLEAIGGRMVVLVRDPRDVAVSTAGYLAGSPHHPLHARFAPLEPEERLMAAIVGLPAGPMGHGLRDLGERVRAISAWADHPSAVLIRYEDLVGPRGGGSAAAQASAIAAVAAVAGVQLTHHQASAVGEAIYGGTPTFRQGRTGRWRDHLTARHVAAAGPLVGDLLITLGYERDEDWWRLA